MNEPSAYRPYTTDFDVVVSADDLDSALGKLGVQDRQYLNAAWREFEFGLLPWKTRVQIISAEAASQVRQRLTAEERRDTVISLLLDQSGSMRGQKILYTTATAEIMQEFFGTLGIACEILGFTTSRWKGGRSRRRWRWRLRPRNPGRLNDLLHIIYKEAMDTRVGTGGWSCRQMLRPDLPKENIDGEAIEWAVSRLSALPQKRKILIVLSDGAPVDDSTLSANGPTYLHDHLHHVVQGVLSSGVVEIGSFGIGYRTHDFYPVSDYVEAPNEMAERLLGFVSRMLLGETSKSPQ